MSQFWWHRIYIWQWRWGRGRRWWWRRRWRWRWWWGRRGRWRRMKSQSEITTGQCLRGWGWGSLTTAFTTAFTVIEWLSILEPVKRERRFSCQKGEWKVEDKKGTSGRWSEWNGRTNSMAAQILWPLAVQWTHYQWLLERMGQMHQRRMRKSKKWRDSWFHPRETWIMGTFEDRHMQGSISLLPCIFSLLPVRVRKEDAGCSIRGKGESKETQ